MVNEALEQQLGRFSLRYARPSRAGLRVEVLAMAGGWKKTVYWTNKSSGAMKNALPMETETSNRSHLCDTHREEVASMVTHAAGMVFSVVALVMMLVLSGGDPLKIVSAAVFGTSLIVLYSSSTLYHIATTHRWKARFQTLDHICIYLLIAGSYTPFTLITLRGPWGWSIFGAVWAMAIGGIFMKTLWKGKKDHWFSTVLYLLMGWLIVLAIAPLWRQLPAAGVGWLAAGGLSYTLGVVFFAWNRLPFNHAIWHLFVLTGSVCHVFAVSLFVFR
jgi:hemolysin III